MTNINIYQVWQRGFFTILIAFITTNSVLAQKLPSVQTESLAVSNMNIDGKSEEWPKDFSAYNKNVDVYYSIANSDKYLYLVIKATDLLIIRKILLGGITFSINSGKQDITANSQSVSFPIYAPGEAPAINVTDGQVIPTNPAQKILYQDSITAAINQQFKIKSKVMEVYGFREIKDTLLSIYNEYGIKAAAIFDGNKSYTYELGIPLKYIGDTVRLHSFFYNIKLQGYKEAKIAKGGKRPPPPPPIPMKDMILYSPTDFWAEYKF